MLILKYDGWVLSHQVVDGESMYSHVDLTGDFIRSVFIPEKRALLPDWLQLLAEEQGREFGLPEGKVTSQQVGEFELLGTYSEQHKSGYLYLFDRAAIHHIVAQGSEDRYQEVIKTPGSDDLAGDKWDKLTLKARKSDKIPLVFTPTYCRKATK